MLDESVEHILVIKFGALGDLFQAFPAFATLHRSLKKNQKLTLLTEPTYRTLMEKCPWFDRVLFEQRPSRWSLNLLKLAEKCKSKGFDYVLDLQMNDLTKRLYKQLRPQLKEWVGLANEKGIVGLDPAKTKDWHNHQRSQFLLEVMDLPAPEIQSGELDWLITPYQKRNYPSDMVLLAVGSSAKHPHKRWPIKHFISLCTALITNRFTPVLIGETHEIALGEMIKQKIPSIENRIGATNLLELAAYASKAKAIIGNDTGVMHLASLLNVPSVTIFGDRTNPKRHGNRGKFCRHIQEDQIHMIDHYKVFDVMLDVSGFKQRLEKTDEEETIENTVFTTQIIGDSIKKTVTKGEHFLAYKEGMFAELN